MIKMTLIKYQKSVKVAVRKQNNLDMFKANTFIQI